MLLKEFIYFNKEHAEPQSDNRYLSQNDTSILKRTDTRKQRLTLKTINEIRKAAEAHNKERQEDMGLVRKMYAVPPPEPTLQ